jgi:hypothetical protein
MSARSTARKPSNGGGSNVTKPFKYRSINSIAKKRILEQNRAGLEEQHYATAFRVEALEALVPLEDESAQAQRDGDIAQMKEQLVIWEGIIDKYNDELLTLNEAIEAENDTKE